MRMNRTLIGLSTALLLWGPGAAFAEPAPVAQSAQQETQAASDFEALRSEVKRLREELDALKKVRPEAAAEPAPAPVETSQLEERLDLLEEKQKDAVVAGDLPGSIRVPGTELSLRPYGFAELNWIHDFETDNSDIDYATFAPYLPLNGTPEGNRKGRDYFTGRTSRIGLEAGLPTRFGMLGAKIEGDFNNEPRTGDTAQYGSPRNVITQQQTSSYGFRLRHAYGQFGGLLIGQTWSTFMDVDNFPETVDFNGPVGGTIVRQPQIRFSYATPSAGTFTAALENSSSYVLDDEGAVMASSLSRFPDIIVRWDKGFQGGALSVRAMTQELRVKDGEDVEATRRGWGAAASALVKIRGSDFLTLAVTGGEGIGRYLNYIEGAFYDAGADRIQIERAIGFVVGYQLKPADWVRINFAYGMTRNFDNAYTEAIEANGLDTGRFGINRWVQQAHVGPIFTPMKGVDLGLEAIWARRKTLIGETGDMARLNFMARYYIN
ncbi:DcaP family trimeric outer membrane transporter [Archangium sp.]|uniref:DcaP family trimeric outer membrane transporter n=1 Tax=Archangium sp. TaxID=1872627 RepID=UPI002D3C7997|nr:DcaP family trimeric outer membrane transporter [Archangium sp.]HYO51670.1 DcaP family trimeric outer membrane transporter [Archangium sp.]